ncbi:MAG TPA: transcriptional repressor [Opitutae bacterium]|nr:transcriptional repressor [Opitutae bacterium]|tara:strand:+ start:67 stop:537 length:471 start_codon:yes stop_codon:yes gene_type:complete
MSTRKESIQQHFQAFLTSQGHRITGQRLAILEAILSEEKHFTADTLLDKARALDDSISRATIYRTLPLLIEADLIREVDVGKDYKYYMLHDAGQSFQAQVICSDCDKIFEMDAPFMEWYGRTVAERLKLKVASQRLQVTASCPEWEKTGICPHTRS